MVNSCIVYVTEEGQLDGVKIKKSTEYLDSNIKKPKEDRKADVRERNELCLHSGMFSIGYR